MGLEQKKFRQFLGLVREHPYLFKALPPYRGVWDFDLIGTGYRWRFNEHLSLTYENANFFGDVSSGIWRDCKLRDILVNLPTETQEFFIYNLDLFQ